MKHGGVRATELDEMTVMKNLYCFLSVIWLAQFAATADTAKSSLADSLPGHGQITNAGPAALTRWELGARKNQRLSTNITWLTHEPLDFLLRRGDHFDEEPERYARMSDPENLKRMADAGVRYGMIYFYKGFGLEYERPSMEQSKRTADEMHRLGMKVGLYIGGTMFTETLYHEIPEARNWEQRNQDNHWVPYGLQTFRHYACPNEPAYRDYIKRVLKIGVEDLHADQIIFDNIMLQPEPDSCRCPRCIQDFHNFLRRKYPTKDAVTRRFGLPDVDWINVNEWDNPTQPDELAVLNDPVLQEWVRFRCESLANYADDLSDYVKSLNPNVAVLMNIKGVYSWNRYWANAVYHPLYAGHVDILAFDTGGYDARLDSGTGALVSQIRSYKMARELGASCDAPLSDELLAAQHMAFGYETPVPGYAGAPWMAARVATTPILEFFRQYHDRYYTRTTNVADVAVLRNWPSMAYSINAAYVPATLMEQVLIQYKVPFDLLFDEQLQNLDRYQAVILAGQECVSADQVRMLLAYVRRGGTLVIAGNTGEFNEWREQRHSNPFLPARTEGKGRLVYIPQIVRGDLKAGKGAGEAEDAEPGAASQHTPRMSPAQWVLPKNHEAIYDAITNGLPGGLSLTTKAPLTTVAELLTRPETRETLVHFVNFDCQHRLSPFKVIVRKQFSGAIKAVTCFSPDADDPLPLEFKSSGGQISFTMPSMRIYSMVVIAQDAD
jgi:hypothetical protein